LAANGFSPWPRCEVFHTFHFIVYLNDVICAVNSRLLAAYGAMLVDLAIAALDVALVQMRFRLIGKLQRIVKI